MGGATLSGKNAWESGAAGGDPVYSSAFPQWLVPFLSLPELRILSFYRIHPTQIVETFSLRLTETLPPSHPHHVQNSGAAWFSGTHSLLEAVREIESTEPLNIGR